MYSNKSPFNLFLIPVGSPESIWKFSGLGTFEYISALKLLVLKKTKHFKTAKLLKDERAQHFFFKYFLMFTALENLSIFSSQVVARASAIEHVLYFKCHRN